MISVWANALSIWRLGTNWPLFILWRSMQCSTALNICSILKGLVMKSEAPARKASMVSTRLAFDVIKITLALFPVLWTLLIHSTPEFSANLTSEIIRSKWHLCNSLSAFSMLSAHSISPRCFDSPLYSNSLVSCSSSTTRIALCLR